MLEDDFIELAFSQQMTNQNSLFLSSLEMPNYDSWAVKVVDN